MVVDVRSLFLQLSDKIMVIGVFHFKENTIHFFNETVLSQITV